MFLIIADAYSKWIDVHVFNSSTSVMTINKLRSTFATHGLPEICVTDNGSCFVNEEFQCFMKKNGIRHIISAPYHLSTNGLAERTVQTVKSFFKEIILGSKTSIEIMLDRFLFTYQITLHTSTGRSPAELLMNRKLNSALDLLRPNMDGKLGRKREEMMIQ